MKSLKLALCGFAASLAMGGVAAAQDGPTVSYNIGAATDYVFRGVSQTLGDTQTFAGADLASGAFYAGVWVSNVSFVPSYEDIDFEYDIYAGYKPTLGPVALDLGLIYYGYTGDVSDDFPDAAYWEGKIAGSIPVGKGSVGAAVFYSPDFFGGGGPATYAEVNGSFPLTEKATVSAALGYQEVDDGHEESVAGTPTVTQFFDDYATWNVGVTVPVGEGVTLDVRYANTNDDTQSAAGLDISDARMFATIKAAF